MKKRILSCLMALALCLTLLPATAQAAEGESSTEPHTHSNWLTSGYGAKGSLTLYHNEADKTSGDVVNQDGGNWLLDGGNYYLRTDVDNYREFSEVKIDHTIVIKDNVTICLNGQTLESIGENMPVFEVTSGSTLTLTDCKGNMGKVKHTGDGSGSGVNVESGGTFNMYGGTITGNTASHGGGVYVYGGTFNMHGGKITGNTANHGGGVYVEGGKFTMNGTSSITDNTANSNGNGTSGGVYVSNNGTFTMNGGTISRNTADSTDGGVGVYRGTGPAKFEMNGGTITGNTASQGGGVGVHGVDSAFIMYGGTITGNTASQGGGVYVSVSGSDSDKGTFTMNDSASVSGNTATNGGGVYVYSGTFNMNGGSTIGGATAAAANTATSNGGGVYVLNGTFNMNGNASISHNTANQDGGGVNAAGGTFAMNGSSKVMNNTGNGVYVIGGKFTVSGAPTVTGNTKDGDASNVYLTGSEIYITIGGKLTGDKGSIGVTKRSNSVIAKGVNEDYSGKFFSDDNTYEVKYKDTQLVLERTVVLQDQKYTKPTAKTGLFYTGEPQELINRGSSVEGGKMQYSLTSGGDYSDSLPTATNAGTYTVYYKVVGDASHNSVLEQGPIMVTIAKAQLSGTPTITKVTKAGTTLSAVVFKKPDGWPEGTVKWVDKDGNKLNENTVVEAGKEYRWIFNPDPTDDAAKNYENTGGRVVLYENSGTVTPPSGGGSTGGNTGGTTGGTTGGNTGGSSGSSSSGGSSSSDRDDYDSNPIIKTETKNNPDGSTTKTETRRDGSVTQTTTGKDGSVSKTETKKDGSSVTENKAADGSTGTVKTDKNGQTTAETALSSKAIETAKRNGEPVKAPVEVKATRDSDTTPTVKVELPKGAGETKVEIPVTNVRPGTVAVLVHPDGTEEILKDSIPTEDGIRLTVDSSATVKIVDNSKDFIDTRNHWAREEIDFVSARELVNGMTATIYAPNASATRAQLWTILARQNDTDLSGGANWYEKAQLWSKDKGISDGTEPNAAINRAQMVTMLWRAVGQPAAAGSTANFIDVPANAYYARAVAWAVEHGITTGIGGGRFDPSATCTRAQIAAFLARSMK